MDFFKKAKKRLVNSLSEKLFSLDALQEALPQNRYRVSFIFENNSKISFGSQPWKIIPNYHLGTIIIWKAQRVLQ